MLTKTLLAAVTMLAFTAAPAWSDSADVAASAQHHLETKAVTYGYETVNGVDIFFREAGNPENPTIVLLHGFPSSSHQYRNLIRDLSDEFHLIAPDYPGFGASAYPSIDEYDYSFDQFSQTINEFLEQRGIETYSLFIQDYGAPVGMRIAAAHPDRVQSLIVQNGNVYAEGMNEETWAPIMALWESGLDNEDLKSQIANAVFSLEGLQWQYTHGTRNPEQILPDNWLLDHQALSRPGQHEVQLALFYDYRTNVEKYPEWQDYLREHQPPALLVWAEHDAFFPTPGAEGYLRDLNDVDYNLLNTGHFALEEDGALIAQKIRSFMTARNIQ